MRVCSPSTTAQYHHALLRQMEGELRKPLVVMAPKSLLRHPQCVSSLEEMASGSFHPVLDDPLFAEGTEGVEKVLVASGKVVYDLLGAREKGGRRDVALLRLEQLYPFPGEALGRALARYPRGAEVAWVQEEPRNMGAWSFITRRIERLLPIDKVGYVGRPARASVSEGYPQTHQLEQQRVLEDALAGREMTFT